MFESKTNKKNIKTSKSSMRYQILKLTTLNSLHAHTTLIKNWFSEHILYMNKLNKLRINIIALTCTA